MILLTEKTMTLQQPADVVFTYLTNMENYGEWFPGVVSVVSVDDLPHAQTGKIYKETLNMPDGEASLNITVKQCEQNTLMYTEGDLVPILPAMKMVFSSAGNDSTKFHLSYYARNPQLHENDEIVKALRKDLSERILLAANQLHKMF